MIALPCLGPRFFIVEAKDGLRPERIELPTPSLGNLCSIQLSYGRVRSRIAKEERSANLDVHLIFTWKRYDSEDLTTIIASGEPLRCSIPGGTKPLPYLNREQWQPSTHSYRKPPVPIEWHRVEGPLKSGKIEREGLKK